MAVAILESPVQRKLDGIQLGQLGDDGATYSALGLL